MLFPQKNMYYVEGKTEKLSQREIVEVPACCYSYRVLASRGFCEDIRQICRVPHSLPIDTRAKRNFFSSDLGDFPPFTIYLTS